MKYTLSNVIKKVISTSLIFILLATPVFSVTNDEVQNEDISTEITSDENKDSVVESSEDSLGKEFQTHDVDIDDPEFNKYYFFDEQGNIVEKLDEINSKAKVSRSATTYTHPEKYKNYMVYNCIDVSKYQEDINWVEVRNSGITHVIIRVGYRGQTTGTLNTDTYYIDNINGAAAAGLKVGVYFYSQALNESEAIEEANYTLSLIKNYKSKISMPVVFDYEFGLSANDGGRFYSGKISKNQMTNNCIAFCEKVKSAGYTPMVYANANMLNNYLNSDLLETKYKIWLAHYTSSTNYPGSFYMWQYTSGGSVNGISGRVDMNFIYDSNLVPQKISGFRVYSSKTDSITLTWQKATNTDGYIIYRSKSQNGTYERVNTISSVSQVSWTDYNINPSTGYYYKIRGYKNNNGTYYYGTMSGSIYVKSKSANPDNVTGLRLYQNGAERIVMAWKSVSNADGYILYRSKSKLGSFQKMETASGGTRASVADYSIAPATGYYYKIQAYQRVNGKYYYSSLSSPVYVKSQSKYPSSVNNVRLYQRTGKSHIITWSSATGADGYIVYRATKENGNYQKVETVSGGRVSWADYDIQNGKTYYYKIRAYKAYKGRYYYGNPSSVYKLKAIL